MAEIKKTQLNLSAFTINPGKSGDFVEDNIFTVLAGMVGALIFIMLVIPMLPKPLNLLVVPFAIVWFMGLQYVISRATKFSKHARLRLLTQFANDNGFTLSENQNYTSDGVIFRVGNNDHKTQEIIQGTLYGFGFSMYQHSFTSGSVQDKKTEYYGVMEIDLPKTVPYMFIDSKSNDWLASEKLDIFKNHDLFELEGDFNKYFRVYASRNYNIEILTLLNPEFMNQLIDNAKGIEIELVDNKAFIYIKKQANSEQNPFAQLIASADFLTQTLGKQLETFVFTAHSHSSM